MTQRFREPEPKHKEPVHPVWRGIGCLLLIIIPIISFAIATLLVEQGLPQQYVPISPDMGGLYNVPGFGRIPLLYTLVVTAVVTVLGFIILTVVYSMVFRVGSGSRYGPLDAPPIKRKVRKSR